MMEQNQRELWTRKLRGLREFNEWEQENYPEISGEAAIEKVSDLYEMLPEDARFREVNVSGIIRMRELFLHLTNVNK